MRSKTQPVKKGNKTRVDLMHDKEIMEYEITNDGLKVLEPFKNIDGIMTGTPQLTSPGEKSI